MWEWFKDKLCLHQNVEVTLCAHLWPGKPDDRRALWLELHRCFPRAALHFTGTPEFSQPRVGEDPEEPDADDVTSVHAKLIMLEFPRSTSGGHYQCQFIGKILGFQQRSSLGQRFPQRTRFDQSSARNVDIRLWSCPLATSWFRS